MEKTYYILYRNVWILLNYRKSELSKGSFNNYVDKMRGEGGQKMSVFVHARGIKTVHGIKIPTNIRGLISS